jgi:hypothetical protein
VPWSPRAKGPPGLEPTANIALIVLPVRDDLNAGDERDDQRRDNDDDRQDEDVDLDDLKIAAHLRTEIPLGDGRRVVVSYPNDLSD